MNRRDFLRPRHLAQIAGQVMVVLDAHPKRKTAGAHPLLRVARRAMATTFEIMLPYGTPNGLDAATAGLDEIDRVEALLTVYGDNSEASRLNREAPHGRVAVDEELYALLERTGQLSADTGGAFDVTSGALVKAWGFHARMQRVPSASDRALALARVGMRHVVLDPRARTVRYALPGLEVNFGSIGKGYALDQAAACLRRAGIESALLQGGHSSVYALGTGPDGQGWAVGVRHPWESGRRLAVVRLCDRGLGTSAATYQYLDHEGRRLGHILDPRTGWPAAEVASASALAATAADADALATSFYVLGLDEVEEYCQKRPDVAALVLPDGARRALWIGFEEPGESKRSVHNAF